MISGHVHAEPVELVQEPSVLATDDLVEFLVVNNDGYELPRIVQNHECPVPPVERGIALAAGRQVGAGREFLVEVVDRCDFFRASVVTSQLHGVEVVEDFRIGRIPAWLGFQSATVKYLEIPDLPVGHSIKEDLPGSSNSQFVSHTQPSSRCSRRCQGEEFPFPRRYDFLSL